MPLATKTYMVWKDYGGHPSIADGFTRQQVIDIQTDRARRLAYEMEQLFPNKVELEHLTMLGPFIKITASSEEDMNCTAHELEDVFQCKLVDAMTPIKLIQ